MRVYTDAARDDEVIGVAWVIVSENNSIEGSRYIEGEYTSIEAEYFALLDGIRMARRESRESVSVYCDCQPLLEKMKADDTGWNDRKDGCLRLLNKFDEWEMNWIPRDENARADRLAYEALESGRQS